MRLKRRPNKSHTYERVLNCMKRMKKKRKKHVEMRVKSITTTTHTQIIVHDNRVSIHRILMFDHPKIIHITSFICIINNHKSFLGSWACSWTRFNRLTAAMYRTNRPTHTEFRRRVLPKLYCKKKYNNSYTRWKNRKQGKKNEWKENLQQFN